MNTELFKKIHDLITAQPERLVMSTWESRNHSCGTTNCLAGHAIVQVTGQAIWEGQSSYHRGVGSAARELAVRLLGTEVDDDGDYPFVEVGAELLGLTEEEAEEAFYLSNENGRKFIRLAAEGKEDEARALLW